MQTIDQPQNSKSDQTKGANCGVSSAFNTAIGVIAVVVAGVIGYFLYQFLVG